MARSGGVSESNKRASSSRGKAAAGKHSSLRANASAGEPAVEVEPLVDGGASRDIAGVVLAVVAVASFIAVITPTSAPVTSAIASFYHLGFGLGAYVLPLALLAVAALLFLRDRMPVPPRTCVGVCMIFIAVISMLSLSAADAAVGANAMFGSETLAATGGWVGAVIASALMSALGKPIGFVILIGLVVLGLVIIGFSVSDVVRGAQMRAQQLASRRHVDVNESPWGDASALEREPAPAPVRMPRRERSGMSGLFDADGTAETTFLGDRAKTTLLGATDDAEPEDDNPFVDVSAQVAAEGAKTTLIPVKERFAPQVDEVDAMPVAAAVPSVPVRGLDVISAARENLEQDAPAVPDAPFAAPAEEAPAVSGPETSAGTVVTPEGDRPIPSFLMAQVDMVAETADAKEPTGLDGSSRAKAPEDTPSKPLDKKISASDAPGADAEEQRLLPPASILRHNPASASAASSEKELEETAGALQSTLNEFGLHSRVVGWISGPTVTTFKVQPGEGERVSRISNLEDDIALSLASTAVRIFAPIPGTSLVGIEIPNRTRQNVNLGDVLPYVKGGPLELAIGRDSEGAPIVADLAKMPHLLIAGTTGSGKSVMINTIIMSLLMRTFPEDVRLIMVDPKRVELAGYNGLPHLYVPVVTEPKQAASALQWAVSEMERRLKVFERIGVRKISTFNEKQAAGEFEHYDNPPAKMPYLVIIIDELSDLMMVAGKDVEASIVRIAQLGRAAGIHLIVATQRPSSNVVTGLIKANITNRIAFNVATGIDSRVIIDQTGAEKLTGYGDMLFSKVDWGKPKRIQGCFVSDDEINQVVEFVKDQGEAEYHEEILSAVAPAMVVGGGAGGAAGREASEDDPLLWDAAHIVVESQLGSTSGLQRRLKVGYARAGRIMDMLEEKGVVGPPDGSKPREVLLDEEGLAELESVEARMAEEDGSGVF